MSLGSMKIDLNLAIYRYKKFNSTIKIQPFPNLSKRISKIAPSNPAPRINNPKRNQQISAAHVSIDLQKTETERKVFGKNAP